MFFFYIEPIVLLIKFLETSLSNPIHKYMGFSAFELAEGLIQIASNDVNKKQVRKPVRCEYD